MKKKLKQAALKLQEKAKAMDEKMEKAKKNIKDGVKKVLKK